MAELSQLVGLTLKEITSGTDEITFVTTESRRFQMYHSQGCCESVEIEDINGDLNDLIGTPITLAEEVSNYEPSGEADIEKTKSSNEWGSCTWTFYKLATVKGYVDIRWFGESNGYYSESVDFIELGVDHKY